MRIKHSMKLDQSNLDLARADLVVVMMGGLCALGGVCGGFEIVGGELCFRSDLAASLWQQVGC